MRSRKSLRTTGVRGGTSQPGRSSFAGRLADCGLQVAEPLLDAGQLGADGTELLQDWVVGGRRRRGAGRGAAGEHGVEVIRRPAEGFGERREGAAVPPAWPLVVLDLADGGRR